MLVGTNLEIIEQLRKDIREFKEKVDKVVLIWTANTEESIPDIETLELIESKINNNESLPASVLYCYAALNEGITYLNGSP